MLVDVAHEKLIAILLGKNISEIESGASMCGEVSVVPNRRDVIVHVWIEMRLALLVIVTTLDNVKEVGNDAARCETLAHIIEIEAPGIGQTVGEDFEFVLVG